VRALLAVAALLLAAGFAGADDGGRGRPDVTVLVPVPLPSAERSPGDAYRRLIPGTVAINGAPYVCDLDDQRFTERDAFVAHLRAVHRTPVEQIPGRLLVLDGRVHFVPE
jgi:hypothetical protein